MFSKGTTWPPKVPTRARDASGTTPPKSTDGRERGRSPSESTVAATGDNRSNESHWESVIDRATD
jgi:hypothetical protein